MEVVSLLERISKKEAKALEDFYIKYGSMVKNIAFKTGLNDADSDEILNDILYKVWINAKRVAKLSNPMGYILTMAYNLAIDHQRKNSKDKLINHEVDVNNLGRINKNLDLSNVLEKLEDIERTILFLKVIYNYTYQEISKITKLSIKQVRIRYEKALINLKKYCDEEESL